MKRHDCNVSIGSSRGPTVMNLLAAVVTTGCTVESTTSCRGGVAVGYVVAAELAEEAGWTFTTCHSSQASCNLTTSRHFCVSKATDHV